MLNGIIILGTVVMVLKVNKDTSLDKCKFLSLNVFLFCFNLVPSFSDLSYEDTHSFHYILYLD